MSSSPLNREARLHRLHNQRRIALSLIERIQIFLHSGRSFRQELAQLFREQGKFGSRDRRLYKELIFTYLRYQPWLEPLRRDSAAFLDDLIALAAPTEEVRPLYSTIEHRPQPNTQPSHRHRLLDKSDEDLAELLPGWFASHLSQPLETGLLLALFERPPLWLRLQKGEAETVLKQCRAASRDREASIEPHPEMPDCIRAPSDLPLANLPAYLDGSAEVQDISSQALLHLLPERPSGRWLDACAGAGGKSLQLAQLMQPGGKVFAYDKRQAALRELDSRRQRAGIASIQILSSRHTAPSSAYDGVLIDAPCSGSGTWRRHPYLMRQTREQDIMDYTQRQLRLLDQYAALVADGGLLVYSTCSLSRFENEWVAQRFLEGRNDFAHLPLASRFGLQDSGQGITVHPHHLDGDGLYIACFRKSRP